MNIEKFSFVKELLEAGLFKDVIQRNDEHRWVNNAIKLANGDSNRLLDELRQIGDETTVLSTVASLLLNSDNFVFTTAKLGRLNESNKDAVNDILTWFMNHGENETVGEMIKRLTYAQSLKLPSVALNIMVIGHCLTTIGRLPKFVRLVFGCRYKNLVNSMTLMRNVNIYPSDIIADGCTHLVIDGSIDIMDSHPSVVIDAVKKHFESPLIGAMFSDIIELSILGGGVAQLDKILAYMLSLLDEDSVKIMLDSNPELLKALNGHTEGIDAMGADTVERLEALRRLFPNKTMDEYKNLLMYTSDIPTARYEESLAYLKSV